MKKTLKIFAILFLSFYYNSYAQQMVQSTNDIYRLKENEENFINKPLKILLKELKIEITTAFVYYDDPSFFDFRFTSLEQQRKDEGTIADRVALFVYVNDTIDWKWPERPKGREVIWTKEDAEKYGNLIVTRIGVVY